MYIFMCVRVYVCAYLSVCDYCNSLFSGCNDDTIADMQSILNAAARMVYGVGRFSHTEPTLKELHWLPVRTELPIQDGGNYLSLPHGCLPSLPDGHDLIGCLEQSSPRSTFG